MQPTYYLSSLESYLLKPIRTCTIVAIKHFDTGKECAIARVDPPIPAAGFGMSADVTEVVLATRHLGYLLSNIQSFPCFVHVAVPLVAAHYDCEELRATDFITIAWAELYRTRADAENHRFDARG